jgi:omega-6 fatty acid desaturase (delta-12 desaturase)
MHAAAEGSAALDPLSKIIRKIPRHCFAKDERRAVLYLLRDFVLAAFVMVLIIQVHSWWLAPALAVLLGSALTGIFVVGHDAGHRSYSDQERRNNFVGHLTTSLVLWPFHVWRLSHDHHHRWTHHADHEIAWRPLTRDEFDGLSPLKRSVYRKIRSSWFFLASGLFQYVYVVDALKGRFFDADDADDLRFSIRLTAVVGLVYMAATIAAGGLYGFLFLFVVPQLVFQIWMSTFTLLHHTSPENLVMAEGDWSPEKAQLASSVQIFFPPVVDWLTHDIAWHVPHHVCVGIPHYRLRDAHQALRQAYPSHVTERDFSWPYLRHIIDHCHIVNSARPGDQAWLSTTKGAGTPYATDEGRARQAVVSL